MDEYAITTRRFSRAEYERLVGVGFFHPGEPIELIGGELMIAEPQGAYHYGAIWKAAHVLARAGLADYWVVNLIDRVLEVYREPVPDADAPFGWRYARREVLDAPMVARPLAAPQAAIRVADLLP